MKNIKAVKEDHDVSKSIVEMIMEVKIHRGNMEFFKIQHIFHEGNQTTDYMTNVVMNILILTIYKSYFPQEIL